MSEANVTPTNGHAPDADALAAMKADLGKLAETSAKPKPKAKPKAAKTAKPKIKAAKATKTPKAAKPKAKTAPTLSIPKFTLKMKALDSLGLKLKAVREKQVCLIKGCNRKTMNTRAIWCDGKDGHRSQIRTEQLRLNNVSWRKRVEQGKAGHHVVYRNRPTVWAFQNKKQALALAKKGNSILPMDKLEKIIERKPSRLKEPKA